MATLAKRDTNTRSTSRSTSINFDVGLDEISNNTKYMGEGGMYIILCADIRSLLGRVEEFFVEQGFKNKIKKIRAREMKRIIKILMRQKDCC